MGIDKSEERLMPVHTDMPPPPDEILRIVRCNCHTDCSSKSCTCRKHDVKCSPRRICANIYEDCALLITSMKLGRVIEHDH